MCCLFDRRGLKEKPEDEMAAPATFYEWAVAPFVRGMHAIVFGALLWFTSLFRVAPDKRDKSGRKPARWAAYRSYKEPPLSAPARCEIQATVQRELTLICAFYPNLQELEQRVADVHKRDVVGCTAAHCAAYGDPKALLALLNAGCEIDAIDSYNNEMTPLMCAADQGHAKCLKLLIHRGADLRKRDKFGCTAAHYAVKRDRKGALSILLNAGCEIDASDCDGASPLTCAADQGHVECLQLLVQHGADVHKRDMRGRTAAHCAEVNDHKEALLVLLDAGCEIDATDSNESTLLMRAADEGHVECLQLLIQRGADVKRHTRGGSTAAHFAALRGHLAALQVLVAFDADVVSPLAGGWSVADCAALNSHVDALFYALACGCRLEALSRPSLRVKFNFCSVPL